MDMFMAARYFDLTDFESYDFVSDSWTAGDFSGQLRLSDSFKTIYHRPTRKRMLSTAPDSPPLSTVIRVKLTQEVFILGALQEDVHKNTHYRDTWALHKPRAKTTIYRTAPAGPANNPGWAAETVLETTFIDFELRSVNENEDQHLIPRGHYVATLPASSAIDRGDRVTVENETFWCVEAYWDSSMRAARMVNRPTHWDNLVYRSFLGNVYTGGANSPTYADSNVTGRAGPLEYQEGRMDLNATNIKIMVNTSWIGVTPKLDDRVVWNSKEYKVYKVERDVLEDQWVLWVKL